MAAHSSLWLLVQIVVGIAIWNGGGHLCRAKEACVYARTIVRHAAVAKDIDIRNYSDNEEIFRAAPKLLSALWSKADVELGRFGGTPWEQGSLSHCYIWRG